jgi:rhamnogalacturonyl hydrolase YesR
LDPIYQLLNDTSSYLETSATAMNLYGFIEGNNQSTTITHALHHSTTLTTQQHQPPTTHTLSLHLHLYGFIEGVLNGWLPKSEFAPAIDLAWKGLLKTIDPTTGKVSGICNGFGFHKSAEEYKNCPTLYEKSHPGLGSVLRAIVAMHRYNSSTFVHSR